jgi:hypothetical protein
LIHPRRKTRCPVLFPGTCSQRNNPDAISLPLIALLGFVLPYPSRRLEAVHARHLTIHDDDVMPMLSPNLNRIETTTNAVALATELPKQIGCQPAVGFMILDYQNARTRAAPLQPWMASKAPILCLLNQHAEGRLIRLKVFFLDAENNNSPGAQESKKRLINLRKHLDFVEWSTLRAIQAAQKIGNSHFHNEPYFIMLPICA